MMILPEFLHEQDGEIRLKGHRISLWDLITFSNEGYSAEMLREQFPTLSMAQIHQVLGFYWEHKTELDAAWAEVRKRIEAQRAEGYHLDRDTLRARLAARDEWETTPDRAS